MAPKDFAVPLAIIGRGELSRMIRELGRLDDFFVAAASQKSGAAIQPPRITRMLDELARINKINLLEAGARKELSTHIQQLMDKAPSLNISFAAEPSPKALESILTWFRANIHPQTLLSIGLQPTIAAGCVLRTPNKIFDMSVASRLKSQQDYLAKLIDGAVSGRG